MTREERENALHCLKVMIGEEVCEECNLYGTTGTDHCEADCVRVAIKALEQESKTDVLDKIRAEIEGLTYYWCEVNPKTVINDVIEIIDKYRQEG